MKGTLNTMSNVLRKWISSTPIRLLSSHHSILILCGMTSLFMTPCMQARGEPNTQSATQISSSKLSTKSSPIMLEHQVKTIDGESVSLSMYRNQVLLIVNTASRCGYTSQYKELVELQSTYGKRGFTVLAFPCNDFGGQEPGSAQEIKSFCDTNFNINFPLFDKVHARGEHKSPIYQTLTSLPAPIGGEIRWNFTKFLVNAKGEVIRRFEPSDSPTSAGIKKSVEAALSSMNH